MNIEFEQTICHFRQISETCRSLIYYFQIIISYFDDLLPIKIQELFVEKNKYSWAWVCLNQPTHTDRCYTAEVKSEPLFDRIRAKNRKQRDCPCLRRMFVYVSCLWRQTAPLKQLHADFKSRIKYSGKSGIFEANKKAISLKYSIVFFI